MTDVSLTALANRQLRALRGDRRTAALRVLAELEKQGCGAAGYRLTGLTLDHICCRHLYGDDRMLSVWPADDNAQVVSIARHNKGTADVYDALTRALGLEVEGDERTKPPCCGDEDGLPPVDADVADAVAVALHEASRRR